MNTVNYCDRYIAGQQDFSPKAPSQSHKKQSPPPQEKRTTEKEKNHQPKPLNSGLELPFFSSISSDADQSLIIGILLLLMSEKADKLLIFALIYILT